MYKELFACLSRTPELYAPSTAPFWDDEHISAQMLAAHLDANWDAASRKHAFMDKSARWIADNFLRPDAGALLDLGCGPGLYAERFCEAGFAVTGVDISRRSIAYARESAQKRGLAITYLRMNYLDIAFERAFDVATLIYCDYGVLPPEDRRALLAKVRAALKPGGVLILDAHTEACADDFAQGCTLERCERGFWRDSPYVCVQNNVYYPETRNCLSQHVVMAEDSFACYNIWNQYYSAESLTAELESAGFSVTGIYGDVAGKAYAVSGDTICCAARSQ